MKKDEKYIRTELSKRLEQKIEDTLIRIIEMTNMNLRYFSIYPLIYLELGYSLDPIPESIHNLDRRGAVSWVFTKTKKYIKERPFDDTFISEEYDFFLTTVMPVIHKLYQDSRTLREIKDHRSINRSLIEAMNEEENRFTLKTGFVSDKYRVESFYFEGIYDSVESKRELEWINEYTKNFTLKYLPNSTKAENTLKRLDVNIDLEQLEKTKERVSIDFNKLADDFNSPAIDVKDNLIKVVAFLYYISTVKKLYSSILEIKKNPDHKRSLVISYDFEWLVKKIHKTMNISELEINKYINYLTLYDKGSLFEFPLIHLSGRIYFIPSAVILNDWHFNITNGHYIKNIDFNNRADTISTKFVNNIKNNLKNYSNLMLATEIYYEFGSATLN